MKLLPWLVAAMAVGFAAFAFIENRETARRVEALQDRLDQARAAAIALEKARAAELEARNALDLARQKALAAERAKAEVAARDAQRASHEAYQQMLAAQRRALEVERARDAARKARDAQAAAEVAALREELDAQKRALEAERTRLAVEKANAERMAAEARAAAERARQLARIQSIPSSEAHKAATDLEAVGRGQEAVQLYIRSARSGNCEAALRLGEIYDKGLVGVSRNYAESLKWYNAARVLGCDVPLYPRS